MVLDEMRKKRNAIGNKADNTTRFFSSILHFNSSRAFMLMENAAQFNEVN
jgi:hypothetical protein